MATAVQTAPKAGASVVNGEKEMAFVPFLGKEEIKLTVSIVQNMLCTPTKKGARIDAMQAMKFMMLCKARGLNPYEGDAYCVGYDSQDGPVFNLITAHQAFVKRAEVHPEFDGFESGVIVKTAAGEVVDRIGDFYLDDDILLGAWCVVYYKTRAHHMTKRLKLSTFKKGTKIWQENSGGMIVKCAEADALRAAFPSMLGGMYMDGEMPLIVDAKASDAAPQVTSAPKSKSDLLAQKLGGRTHQTQDQTEADGGNDDASEAGHSGTGHEQHEENHEEERTTEPEVSEQFQITIGEKLGECSTIDEVKRLAAFYTLSKNHTPAERQFVAEKCDEREFEIKAAFKKSIKPTDESSEPAEADGVNHADFAVLEAMVAEAPNRREAQKVLVGAKDRLSGGQKSLLQMKISNRPA